MNKGNKDINPAGVEMLIALFEQWSYVYLKISEMLIRWGDLDTKAEVIWAHPNIK